MQTEAILALALTVLLGALAVFAARFEPIEHGIGPRRRGVPVMGIEGAGGRRGGRWAPLDGMAVDEPGAFADLRPSALDRVLRVGTWVFLFATTVVVAATGLWPGQQGVILALLAMAAVYTFVIHELLPARVRTTRLLAVEGVLGLVFGGLLVALTGGAFSPFSPVLALIVVAAAIVVSQRVTVALTAAAGIAYVAAVLAGGPVPMPPPAIATTGVGLTALCLVAFVGTAIGREQRRAWEVAVRRATVDDLTGLRNRSWLFSALEREIDRHHRTGRAFCLLMIDLDNLKVVNDRFGHLAGDAALRVVGEVIRSGIRRIDTGARIGGDEFVVLLPETDPTGGWVLAEKVRRGVAGAGLSVDGRAVPTAVSVGIATCPHDGVTAADLFDRADSAMFQAKRSARRGGAPVPVMPARPRTGDRSRVA